jgi:hypothetical protein
MSERLKGNGHRWGAFVPCAVLLVLAALSLREWWLIGYIADPETIAAYRFGSDAMVGKGGSYYRSAELYAASALQFAGLLAVLAIPFVVALRLRSRGALIMAYVILIVAAIAKQVVPYAL